MLLFFPVCVLYIRFSKKEVFVVRETKLYIGLNDMDTLKQEHGTCKYISILQNVCRSYQVPFTFAVEHGGYIHEDGRYTEEQTLVVSMIDIPDETVSEIAKDLCVFFRQESVLITEDIVKMYYISEKL